MAYSSLSTTAEPPTASHSNFTPLQSTQDDDASAIPTSLASSNTPLEDGDTSQIQELLSHATRSQTPRPRLPSDSDLKRDSGIAASFNTADNAPSSAGPNITDASATVHEPRTPAIAVNHGQAVGDSSSIEEQYPDGVPRIGSLKGTQSPVSADALTDISLGDLASERVAFSKRGSLLYAGKRMNTPTALERRTLASASAETRVPDMDGQASSQESAPIKLQPKEAGSHGEKAPPSAPTTPASVQSSRMLSTEDMTFSSRVRSMYEHGSERAASWTTPTLNGIHEDEVAESFTTEKSTPEPTSNGVVVEKTRQMPADGQSTNDFAGGIEDWEDIDGQDVDRYGFINPKRISSRSSAGDRASNDGVQRVATRLKVEANRPRKGRLLRRMPSNAGRSSQSLPLADERGDRAGTPSVYSTRTQQTTFNSSTFMILRSKDRRAVTQASDMLTLPPGLAQIAEAADGGRTASSSKQKEWSREEKWREMARSNSSRRTTTSKGGGMRFEFDTTDPKLINRTWKGIPDRWRATAWHSFLSSSARKRNKGISDEEIIQQYRRLQDEGSADDVQIDMDVPRTISLHVMFRRRYRGGQRLLFRVLHAISLYFPDTGYVQGMASLAATLLCYFEEETAFVMLVRLWQLRGLEQLFAAGFGGLMKALENFERDWLAHGGVAKKLDELGVHSTAYGTRWYLTLFNMSIPFPAQLRVWDVFMLLGDAPGKPDNGFGGADLDVLHATSAALIDATREIILDSDFENAMKVLTSFVPIKDEDLLMRVAKAEWKQRKKRG